MHGFYLNFPPSYILLICNTTHKTLFLPPFLALFLHFKMANLTLFDYDEQGLNPHGCILTQAQVYSLNDHYVPPNNSVLQSPRVFGYVDQTNPGNPAAVNSTFMGLSLMTNRVTYQTLGMAPSLDGWNGGSLNKNFSLLLKSIKGVFEEKRKISASHHASAREAMEETEEMEETEKTTAQNLVVRGSGAVLTSITTLFNIIKQQLASMPEGMHRQCKVMNEAVHHNVVMQRILEYNAEIGVSKSQVLSRFRSRIERWYRWKSERGWDTKDVVDVNGLLRVKEHQKTVASGFSRKLKPMIGIHKLLTTRKFCGSDGGDGGDGNTDAQVETITNAFIQMDMCVHKHKAYTTQEDGRKKRTSRPISEPKEHTLNDVAVELAKTFQIEVTEQCKKDVQAVMDSMVLNQQLIKVGIFYRRNFGDDGFGLGGGETGGYKRQKVGNEPKGLLEIAQEHTPGELEAPFTACNAPIDPSELDELKKEIRILCPDVQSFGGFDSECGHLSLAFDNITPQHMGVCVSINNCMGLMYTNNLEHAKRILETNRKECVDSLRKYVKSNTLSVFYDDMCDHLACANEEVTAHSLSLIRSVYTWELMNTRLAIIRKYLQNLYDSGRNSSGRVTKLILK